MDDEKKDVVVEEGTEEVTPVIPTEEVPAEETAPEAEAPVTE